MRSSKAVFRAFFASFVSMKTQNSFRATRAPSSYALLLDDGGLSRLIDDGVLDGVEPLYFDPNHVPGNQPFGWLHDRSYTTGGAGADDIAGFERERGG